MKERTYWKSHPTPQYHLLTTSPASQADAAEGSTPSEPFQENNWLVGSQWQDNPYSLP